MLYFFLLVSDGFPDSSFRNSDWLLSFSANEHAVEVVSMVEKSDEGVRINKEQESSVR